MRSWILRLDTDEMAEKAMSHTVSKKEVHFIWVAWGEKHIREAIAGARLCQSWNKYANPNAMYFVYILDDWHNIPDSLLRKQEAHGVQVILKLDAKPTNPALFDTCRLNIMAEHDTPTMYVDTDLYILCPLPIDSFGVGMKTFGMGLARIGFNCNRIHGMVDDVLDAESSIYYTDCGLEKKHFEAPRQFWPWIRINMGQIWSGKPELTRDFAASFEEANMPFAQTGYFGVGEMIFTAMHNAGLIPEHEFDWRNGWNKIWPFIDKVEAHAGVIEDKDSRKANGIYPVAHHDILHVGHFGVQTHLGWTEAQRPMQIRLLDDDSLELLIKHVTFNTSYSKTQFSPIAH